MTLLFDIPPVEKEVKPPPFPDKRCRDCKHIANLNYFSDKYWYCIITPSKRTPYGVKAIKRMQPACEKFES